MFIRWRHISIHGFNFMMNGKFRRLVAHTHVQLYIHKHIHTRQSNLPFSIHSVACIIIASANQNLVNVISSSMAFLSSAQSFSLLLPLSHSLSRALNSMRSLLRMSNRIRCHGKRDSVSYFVATKLVFRHAAPRRAQNKIRGKCAWKCGGRLACCDNFSLLIFFFCGKHQTEIQNVKSK